MSICERMFAIMEKKSIKMVDVSNVLGVSKSVISTWKKRNTNPPAEYIERICELLNVSIEYFITGKEKNNINENDLKFLEAYKKASPAIREGVNKMLDITKDNSERLSESKTG